MRVRQLINELSELDLKSNICIQYGSVFDEITDLREFKDHYDNENGNKRYGKIVWLIS
jgi:hypothetical protein